MEERRGSQEEKGVSNVIPFEFAGRIRKSGRQASAYHPAINGTVKKEGKSMKKGEIEIEIERKREREREREREKYGDFFSSCR